MAMVVNMRGGADYPRGIRIDRRTKWGNPYRIGPDGSREQVIELYRRYLWRRIGAGECSLEELAELHGHELMCWCAPEPCHGDVLVKAAKWAKRQLTEDPGRGSAPGSGSTEKQSG